MRAITIAVFLLNARMSKGMKSSAKERIDVLFEGRNHLLIERVKSYVKAKMLQFAAGRATTFLLNLSFADNASSHRQQFLV